MELPSKDALFGGMLEWTTYNKNIISKFRFLKSAYFISFTIFEGCEIIKNLNHLTLLGQACRKG